MLSPVQSIAKRFGSWLAAPKPRTIRRGQQRAQLQFDTLEDRITPTHFRYGTIDWVGTPNSNTVTFRLTQAWRRDFPWSSPTPNPVVQGSTVNTGHVFNFGDNTSAQINLTVTSVNPTDNSFIGTTTLTHTYPTTGDRIAWFEGCCRISTLQGGNNDTNYRNQTRVDVGTGNSSPVSSTAPIIDVPDNQIWTFQLPATDPNSDSLTYRLAAQPEWGGNTHPGVATPSPTDNLTISPTGLITWNIQNASAPNIAPGQVWATQFIVEDRTVTGALKSSIPVDVILRIAQEAAVNQAPTLTANPPGPFQPVAGQTLTFDVTATDPDALGAIISLEALNAPSGMTFSPFGAPAKTKTITATWTPTQAQANSTFVVTFEATDNQAGKGTTSVTITPAPNQPPKANDDSYSVNEDATLNVSAPGVLGNDSDPENNAMTAVLGSPPANGSVSLNSNGSFSYTPNANFFGTDSFTYRAKDANGAGNLATVTITVNPLNDTPSADDDSATTDEDTPVVIAVLDNDSAGPANESGQTLTPSIVTPPAHGLAVVNGDGTITYTPAGDYFGADSFTYRVNDGSAFSAPATVDLTITSVNDAPSANDDLAETDEDTPVAIAVLDNDTVGPANESGQSLTITHLNGIAVGAGDSVATAHGMVTLNGDGTVTYAPALNYNGPDSFTYTIEDSGAPPLSDSANGTVTINAVNDAPVAQDDSYTVAEDNTLTIAGTGVLGNDTDVDGDVLSVATPRPISAPAHGILTLNDDGSFTYTPFTHFHGTDSFTYKASDGIADSNLSTVTITVTSVNDAPVANDDTAITDEDTPVTIPVLANDTDVDGTLAAGSVTISAGPSHGSAVVNPDGTVLYTPALNYNGPDSFTYTVLDNDGAVSNVATVAITVNPVNDAPVANDDQYNTDEDVTLDIAAPGVRGNDTDVENNVLVAILVTPPSHGGVTLHGDGSFTYTPDSNYNGSDSFTYQVNDGAADSNVATVHINIAPVNDAPLLEVGHHHATDEHHGDVDEGETARNHGTYGEVDAGNTVTLSASIGTITDNGDGTWNWTYLTSDGPLPAETEVLITATDQDGAETTLGFHLHVLNVDPTAHDDSGATDEDAAIAIDVTANDTDPAGPNDPLTVSAVTQGANGAVTINGDGDVVYTPNADFFGSDSFTYTIDDGDGGSAIGTVHVTVASVNDAPVADDDSDTVAEDGAVTTNVVANDNGGPANEDQTLTVTAVTQGAHGTVTNNSDGTVTYTPDVNYFGPDSYSYTIEDSDGASATATVSITVTEVNDAPVAVGDSAATIQDTPVTGNVLINDTDPDNTDGLPGNEDDLDALLVSGPSFGSLALDAETGAFTYTPNNGFFGADGFTYRAVDGDGALSNIVTVNITVAAAAPGSVYLVPDACDPSKTALIINGTSGDDHVNVVPATGGVQVIFNGTTSAVFNPTGRIVIYGYAGNDNLHVAGTIANPVWLYGDAGNDQLNLGNGGGIAFGGAGADSLHGGTGRDILVGGEGADSMVGNGGDDILLAALSVYDDRFTSGIHQDAWCHLHEEWTRTDATFQERIAHLKSPEADGHNHLYSLNNDTIMDDAATQADSLQGSSGDDWFIFRAGEDKTSGESKVEDQNDLNIT